MNEAHAPLERSLLFWGMFVAASSAVAIGRAFVPGHDLSLAGTYEAFAHIWVGALIAMIFDKFDKDRRFAAGLTLGLLTLLEIVAFALRAK